MKLTDEIRWLKGVGPSRAALLSRLGIGLLGELLLHLPRAWLDRRYVVPVSSVRVGESSTVAGVVQSINRRRSGRGRTVMEALLSDGAPLRLVFFNERYPAALLQKGMQVVASGTVENWRGMAMVHPDLLLPSSDGEPGPPGMLPLYPLTAGLTQGVMRRIIAMALSELEPPPPILPAGILAESGFADRLQLLRGAHHAADPDEAGRARDLLALEELHLYRRALALVRRSARSEPAIPLPAGPSTA